MCFKSRLEDFSDDNKVLRAIDLSGEAVGADVKVLCVDWKPLALTGDTLVES